MTRPSPIWRLWRSEWVLDRPRLMGILNVTPDSFHDQGRHFTVEAALRRAEEILAEGADLIDIGAESSRPGAVPISSEEEWTRLAPILASLRRNFPLPISVDTQHGETARRALAEGVEVINDVSGGRDPVLLKAVAESRAAYVLMHSRGDSATMMSQAVYGDLLGEVLGEMKASLERALAAGIAAESIVLDPGFGFAKTPEQNWRLLSCLDEFQALGRPLLVGLSQKRMIREAVGEDSEHLRLASAVAAGIAAARGARILRVHDVAATRAALQVLQNADFLLH